MYTFLINEEKYIFVYSSFTINNYHTPIFVHMLPKKITTTPLNFKTFKNSENSNKVKYINDVRTVSNLIFVNNTEA